MSRPKKKCNVNCIYYPRYPLEVKKEYTDSFGLKHRQATYLCGYDEHVIDCFRKCKYFKTKEDIK